MKNRLVCLSLFAVCGAGGAATILTALLENYGPMLAAENLVAIAERTPPEQWMSEFVEFLATLKARYLTLRIVAGTTTLVAALLGLGVLSSNTLERARPS